MNSHGYKTNNFDNVAKFQWAKIVDGILEGHWCNAGGTCHGITENTNDTGILASGIAGNLFSCTVTVIDPTGTHDRYGQIVPNPSNVYSQYGIDNFWKSISGLRNKNTKKQETHYKEKNGALTGQLALVALAYIMIIMPIELQAELIVF